MAGVVVAAASALLVVGPARAGTTGAAAPPRPASVETENANVPCELRETPEYPALRFDAAIPVTLDVPEVLEVGTPSPAVPWEATASIGLDTRPGTPLGAALHARGAAKLRVETTSSIFSYSFSGGGVPATLRTTGEQDLGGTALTATGSGSLTPLRFTEPSRPGETTPAIWFSSSWAQLTPVTADGTALAPLAVSCYSLPSFFLWRSVLVLPAGFTTVSREAGTSRCVLAATAQHPRQEFALRFPVTLRVPKKAVAGTPTGPLSWSSNYPVAELDLRSGALHDELVAAGATSLRMTVTGRLHYNFPWTTPQRITASGTQPVDSNGLTTVARGELPPLTFLLPFPQAPALFYDAKPGELLVVEPLLADGTALAPLPITCTRAPNLALWHQVDVGLR
ncbi:hypothetical protein BJP25_10730 [Actinokineospora bangkokensis]|uniref:Secreted protein n=1 Tax=Actinokineospora bangkokensis TaxID=1193682 RepID=A0A1Q9LQI1_9PSEU|nr:hypothetical protein BJP25_10730 [Actinokineospora bangkokensis]